jgi:hypothetical protein
MSDMIETETIRMELDKAFQYAVTLAWEDFTKPVEPLSMRVEYLCAPGSSLDHLSIWSVRAGGYQDLICDYWMSTSSAHSSGAGFGSRPSSDKFAQALDFIMKNQGLFTRTADAGSHGLVLIYPPDADDRTEATARMRAVHADAEERTRARHG